MNLFNERNKDEENKDAKHVLNVEVPVNRGNKDANMSYYVEVNVKVEQCTHVP